MRTILRTIVGSLLALTILVLGVAGWRYDVTGHPNIIVQLTPLVLTWGTVALVAIALGIVLVDTFKR